MTEGYIRVSRVLHGTSAEGPGLRTAIWFQGCSIRCKGCINPHLFSSRGGINTPITEIVDQAVAAGVEGLTLIGGEPFDQPGAGSVLASAAQERGLGVIAFSGYEYESLRGRDEVTDAFLASVDLLIDGPYQATNPEVHRALVGSTNQRFIHLKDRYKNYSPESSPNKVDVRVLPDGSIQVAGYLDSPGLSRLTESIHTSRAFRRNSGY